MWINTIDKRTNISNGVVSLIETAVCDTVSEFLLPSEV